jgi:hypothetical protein
MAETIRDFTKGKMNKSVDKRLIPKGEYIDALNIRFNSTEGSEMGSVENSKGNTQLTTLVYINGTALSSQAKCIGAFEDGSNEKLYWFIHDSNFSIGATGKLDLIVSYDAKSSFLSYHVVSVDNGGGVNTTLNLNPTFLITGVNLIDNMLFFTDDYNPPRMLDVNSSYANPVANVDQFSAESILNIKRPPANSPSVEMINVGQDKNYMEDRYISFAYRYKYKNNEYSATSQFSSPAFFPKDFEFAVDSMLNEGMENKYNASVVRYESGGPLVVGIDLLFKEGSDPTIKVVEKIDKRERGLSDDTTYSLIYDNSKIYTVLPNSEILRHFDNVPLLAKAQTTMGNRLIYGNYKEGYDMIDSNKNPVKLGYYADLISEDLSIKNVNTQLYTATYNVDGAVSVVDGIVNFDLTSLNPSASVNLLKAGTSISFDLEFLHSVYSGVATYPSNRNSFRISFVFNLNRDYSSVYQMASSTEFLDRIGTAVNVLPVYDLINPTSCSGYTFSDLFNCNTPSIGGYTKYEAKHSLAATAGNIHLEILPTSKFIGMRFPVMKYVADTNNPGSNYFYDYFKVNKSSSSFFNSSANRSLHSNRGFDIAIGYMDDFNRSTKPLVSQRNTVHVACGLSDKKNSIKVTIPPTQKVPYWATRYKFFIKPDKGGYDTIYTQFFYEDQSTKDIYFLLEGENAKKVEEGDRYIVKTDTSGVLRNCAVATVLEKKAQSSGFITTSNGAVPLAGVYMKMSPEDFSTQITTTPVIVHTDTDNAGSAGVFSKIEIPCGKFIGPTAFNYEIKARSRIIINYSYTREGGGILDSGCEERRYSFSKSYIATKDYLTMYEWFVGDGIANTIDSGSKTIGSGGCSMANTFYGGIQSTILSGDLCRNKWFFYQDAFANPLKLVIMGTRACGRLKHKQVNASASLKIYEPNGSLIFETIPEDALPDLFFESSESFPITNGLHEGNIQNQTGVQSAIIDTDFFDCFSFGNGVESYKILDSIVGRTFELGDRAVSVSAEDYKEAHRFSDLTYSGVYNDETNVNKLNEFNLGLLNFKPLEDSFGFIQKLEGRKTDVLVLQEDKISYVLAGKDILSDAGGGDALVSVPKVLGQQISRPEEYGISHNPESFSSWGNEKHFTDAKRGVVIQLKGDSVSNESLNVISNNGMSTWFRDLFNTSFNTQKLGGYDPYMGEYVLSSNEQLLPQEVVCSDCNDLRSISIQAGNPYTFCIDAGSLVGMTPITWNIQSITGTITIDALYNGSVTSSGSVSSNGTFDVPKSLSSENLIEITITASNSAKIDLTTACPDVTRINVRWIVISSRPIIQDGVPVLSGFPLTGMSLDNGDSNPRVITERVRLEATDLQPGINFWGIFEGPQGVGVVPSEDDEITMFVQKNTEDTFQFDSSSHKLMYLRTSDVFDNNVDDASALLRDSVVINNIAETEDYTYGQFDMPQNEGDTLYVVWDLRGNTPTKLAYAAPSVSEPDADVCCGYVCDEVYSQYEVSSSNEQVVYYSYTDQDDNAAEDTISPGERKIVVSSVIPTVQDAAENVSINFFKCGI